MSDIFYFTEYLRTTIEQRGNEEEGVMLWLAEIYQAIDELRLEDIRQLVRGAKTFQLSAWGKAQIFLGRGDFHARQHDWTSAIAMYQHGLECLKDCENIESDQAVLLNNLGLVYQEQARYEDAIFSYKHAVQLYDKVHDLIGKIHSISNLASVYDTRGEWESAVQYYKMGIQELEVADDKTVLASFWNNLGVAYQNSGNQQFAMEAFQKCVKILDDMGESLSEQGARVLMNLGEIYAERQQSIQSIQCFQSAIHVCQEIGNTSLEVSVWNNLGAFYAKNDRIGDAMNCYETCLQLTRQTGDHATESLILNNLGSAFEDAHDNEKAFHAFMQSLALAEENQELYGIARAQNNLGVLHEKQHMMDQALSHYAEAVRALHEIGDYYREVTTITNIATLHAKIGNIDDSREWIKRGVSISTQRQFIDHLAFLAILEGDIEFIHPDRFLEACKAYARACTFACHPHAKSLSKIMDITRKRANTLDITTRKELGAYILDSCGTMILNSSKDFHQTLVSLTKEQ